MSKQEVIANKLKNKLFTIIDKVEPTWELQWPYRPAP